MQQGDRSDVSASVAGVPYLDTATGVRKKAQQRGLAQALHNLASLLILREPLDTKALIPSPGLAPTGLAGCWRAQDSNAAWLLPASTRMRYLEIRFAARVTAARARLKAGTWQIYYDSGGGRETNSRAFYYDQNRISVRHVMSLRGPIYAIRVDPTDFPCEFVVDQFELLAMRLAWGLPKLIAQRLVCRREQGVLGQSIKEFLISLATLRPRRAIRALFGPHALSQRQLYQRWIETRKITTTRRQKFLAKLGEFNRVPVFSIIMPTFNSPAEFLERAIRSVTNQIYPHWELCIADD